ncbi:hypothetical protein Golob_002659 [Gossypium lobatum]|uniref:Uncharacterized protein n=1 Tax=Gossypium lobatum TaxID=34289 RepID=A0A7J8N642_9ROSI|nr:hypothetical protein [Gossypium lobatum]
MEKEFLDKVEDNAAVQIWSQKTQEKGDSLTEEYMSKLWDFTRISWISTYSELLPSIGIPPMVTSLLGRIQADKAYSRAANILTFLKRLMSIIGMIKQWVAAWIKHKRDTWFHSQIWKVERVSYRVFSKNYSLLTEFVAIPRPDNISEEKWMTILQSLRDEDVEWRALWMISDEILYRCGDFY